MRAILKFWSRRPVFYCCLLWLRISFERDAHDPRLSDGIYLPGGIKAGIRPFMHHDALFLISSGGLFTGQAIEHDRHNQVALRQIAHIDRKSDARDIPKSLHGIRAVQKTAQQGALMERDPVHPLHIQGAPGRCPCRPA